MSMIREEEARGRIVPGDSLIEATSGSTGIALALPRRSPRNAIFLAVAASPASRQKRFLGRLCPPRSFLGAFLLAVATALSAVAKAAHSQRNMIKFLLIRQPQMNQTFPIFVEDKKGYTSESQSAAEGLLGRRCQTRCAGSTQSQSRS